MSVAPVRKDIVVEASQARAFRVFTEEQATWWPLATHHIGAKPAETSVIEPRVGGRWFERAEDGTECQWGRVLVWDPPGRVVLQWQINSDFKPDENLHTEVEVRFVVLGPARTRVELEHRMLDAFGDAAGKMRTSVDSGWGTLLGLFGERIRG